MIKMYPSVVWTDGWMTGLDLAFSSASATLAHVPLQVELNGISVIQIGRH